MGGEGTKMEEQDGDRVEERRVWSEKIHQLFRLQHQYLKRICILFSDYTLIQPHCKTKAKYK